MSELQVSVLDIETLNVGTLVTETVNASSMVVSGNVTAARVITSGPSSFQFIERIAMANVQMMNTSNIMAYSTLRWTIEGLLPANTNVTGGPKPWLQVSTDGGTLYANANSFAFHTTSANANSSAVNSNSHDDSNGAYVLTFWGLANNVSSGGGSGIMYMFGNKAGQTTRIQSNFDYVSGENDNGSPWNYQDRGMGRILQPNKITNYRLRLTEGSLIVRGNVIIEGIPG